MREVVVAKMREMVVAKIDDDVKSEDKGKTHKMKFRKTVAAQQAHKTIAQKHTRN